MPPPPHHPTKHLALSLVGALTAAGCAASGTLGPCASGACADAAAPDVDAAPAVDAGSSAHAIAHVLVGTRSLPIGPKREVSWAPLPSAVRAAAPFAVGVDGAGLAVALAVVAGDGPPRVDADTTARALIAVAAGAPYVSPEERSVIWEATASVDRADLRAALERLPTLREVAAGARLPLLVARGAAALQGRWATRTVGIHLADGGDGLRLGQPRLAPDRRTVFVDASLGAEVHEFKALSVDGRVTFLRPPGLPDPLGVAFGGAAFDRYAIPLVPRTPPQAPVRVLAPATVNLIGALTADATAAERRAQSDATMRTIVGQSINILGAILPELLAPSCRAAVFENLRGNVERVAAGRPSASDLRGALWDLVVRVRENLGTVAACVAADDRTLWERVWGLWDTIQSTWEAATGAVEQTLALGELATGPMLSSHRVELCAACPGATETVLPYCTARGGELLCGDAAVCASDPRVGVACAAGVGECRRAGAFGCAGATLLCGAVAGTPAGERCTGGADEDCDGQADCGDPDCARDPACARCPPSACDGRPAGARLCDGAARVVCGAGAPCPAEASRTDCGAALPDANGACAAGACVVASCRAGRGDCDGVASNGCEQNLLTSDLHCGACGRRCGAGTACAAGRCASAACTGYLRIAAPAAGDAVAGASVRYAFDAPGCPPDQRFFVAFRQCCTNNRDCAVGYGPGTDPDLGCDGTATAPFTGTTTTVALPTLRGRWRTSVAPVGQTGLAAPFIVLNLR